MSLVKFRESLYQLVFIFYYIKMRQKKIRILHEYLQKDMENIYTVFENEGECKTACLALMKYYEDQWQTTVEWERDEFWIPDKVQVTAVEKPIYTVDDFLQTLN